MARESPCSGALIVNYEEASVIIICSCILLFVQATLVIVTLLWAGDARESRDWVAGFCRTALPLLRKANYAEFVSLANDEADSSVLSRLARAEYRIAELERKHRSEYTTPYHYVPREDADEPERGG